MRSSRKKKLQEALDRDRAAAEPASVPAIADDEFMVPPPGGFVAREAAAIPMGWDATYEDGYPTLVERLLGQMRHMLYSLDEQQHDIVRLRESTRHVLARLSPA